MNQIGKYKVLGELGRGGFGAVYLCEDNLGGQVAIKVFDPKDVVAGAATSASTDAVGVLRARFKSEARTLRRLSSNPYIVTLYDFDETDDGIPYYVMPYLEQSLVNEIGRDVFSVGGQEDVSADEMPRPIAPQRAIRVLTEILEAMKSVHSEGLVHRDLKPANILFDRAGPAGKVQVCDFGIAKLPDTQHSQSGVGMGSRNYISPEQRESAKHVEASSDVYAIGSIAYRMLTGTLPAGQFQDPIVYAPSIGQPLNDLIIRSMSIDPAKRPKDGGEYLQELKAALKALDESAPADEVTDTWVEQGKAGLRDDLKPLKERIEKLLLAQGEITPEDHETLTGLARIVDLDDAGLNALINAVTNEHIGVLKPVQNFLALLDEQVAAGTVKRDMLMVAGNAIGWDETRVAAVIAGRQSVGEKLGWTVGGSVFIAAIVVVLVSIGGFWVYDQQQQQAAQERGVAEERAEALAERSRQEVASWDEASRANTIAAYEDYRSQSFAMVAHKEEAGDRIAELKRAARAERSRQEVASWDKAQSVNTIAAYEDYRSQSFATVAHKEEAGRRITGLMNRAVAEALAERSRQEVASWDEAQRINTIASYEDYRSQSFATVARKKEVDRRIAELKRAAVERERLVAEARAERSRQEVASWDEAQSVNTIAAYEAYRSQSFATVAHKEEADRRIAELKRAAAEAARAERSRQEVASWDKAQSVNTIAAYVDYRSQLFATVAHKEEAGRRIAKLNRAARSIPGGLFKDCDVCPEMVVIPSGRFQMGSNSVDVDEKLVHTVTIAKPFALGKTEVTFTEYDAFAQATNRSLADDEGWGRGSRPVINVNWDDATAYANWLSDKTGQRYRLPSESEWEYAAWAGSTTKYSWGDSINCRQAQYDCGNEGQTVVVGSFSANPFGLHDMHGNVWEWTQDCWNGSYSGAPANGSAWTSGDCSRRVLRGGSWIDRPDLLRSANRDRNDTSDRYRFYGFRLAQDL